MSKRLFLLVLLVCALPLASAHAGSGDYTTSLQGLWTLDETTGTTANDTAGTAQNGTMQGGMTAATSTVTGTTGTAFTFDGVDDYISMGDVELSNTVITLAGWVKFNAFGASGSAIVSKYHDTGQRSYVLYAALAQKFAMNVSDNGSSGAGNMVGVSGTTIAQTGVWYHVAGTFNNATGTVKIYVNGKLEGTNTDAGVTGIFNGTRTLRIGNWKSAAENYTNGTIDDVRIYDRVLTDDDIKALYVRSAKFCDNPTDAPGIIRFNAARSAMQYCDGDAWTMMGLGSYTPAAVTFDGTNDWLTQSDLVDSNSKMFTGSFWFRRNGGTGVEQKIFRASGARALALLRTENDLQLAAETEGGTKVFEADTTATFTDTNWHHVLFSFDATGASASKRHLYIDGASDINVTAFADGEVDFDTGSMQIGSSTAGGDKLNADIADLWLDYGTYIDFSSAGLRQKFRSANGMPMYLGNDGSLPTGFAPEIFLSGDTASWHTNKGTGGGFGFGGGALSAAASDPGDTLTGPQELAKITGSTTDTGDVFSTSVSIVWPHVLIGSWKDEGGGATRGTAFLFDISDPASPVQRARLTASDGANDDRFGHGVSMDGTMALIGSTRANNGGTDRGKAYLFDVSTPTAPVEKAIITPSDPEDNANFSTGPNGVALSGSAAVIGAHLDDGAGALNANRGAAYLYDVSNPVSPVEKAKLAPSDPQNGDTFGGSVFISGDLAFIGAESKDDAGTDRGAVYIFDISDLDNPAQLFKITASDAANDDRFGNVVAAEGSLAMIGASQEDTAAADSGAVYIFDISSPSAPAELAKITAPDGALDDRFGNSVSFSGNIAVIGAEGDDGAGTNRGAAYFYDISNPASPVFIAKVVPSDTADAALFGGDKIAIHDKVAVIPADFDPALGTDAGAAYVFYIQGLCTGPAGVTGAMIYNTDYNVMQYCNGKDWVAMSKIGGTGGSGCTSPAGTAGEIRFAFADEVLQYCNTQDWVNLGKPAAPTAGLTGHWRFDNASGGTAVNGSAGPNGTWVGGTIVSVAGITGPAFDLNGTTQWINLPSNSLGQNLSAFTIAMWVNPEQLGSVTGYGQLFGLAENAAPNASRIHMAYTAANQLNIGADAPDTTFFDATSVMTLAADTWYHVVGVVDIANDRIKIYINGNEVAVNYPNGIPAWTNTATSNSTSANGCIGSEENDQGFGDFEGSLDDVRFYNRALSANEVKQLYGATR